MTRILHILFAASLLASSASAQTPVPIAPPTSGLLVSYQYWPVQYVQWLGTELPYSMIEFDVDSTAKLPLYNVVLTDRASGKRTVYANADVLVASAKAQGMQAYKTQIAFDAADTTTVGAASMLRLSMADGKPLQWNFVQGSDISEQGAGLTPLPTMPIPIFVYREQAAVAGEGTALQIGNTVSTAEVWTEISKPPHFVAYRGAMSLNAHTAVFAAGKESWVIAAAPSELKAGSTWELDSDTGDHRTLRVERTDGTHATISGIDRHHPGVSFTIEGLRKADGWSIERVRYAPQHDGEKHYMTLQFGTPLTPASTASNLDLAIGRKAHIATASLTLSGAPNDRTTRVQMQTPQWLRGKDLQEQTTTTASTIATVSTPASAAVTTTTK
jgi:hypothetical protein